MTSIFKTANLIALTFIVLPLSQAAAQEGGRSQPFPFQGGEAIYKGVCQGCHMPDAKGATGAGTYPALANNPKLAEAGYPVSVIIHGQKAMPPLGGMLSDKQIADVVTYIRTHFGNHYTEAVNVADVKTAR
jgi:mono/diheme cytochrome c family protein